MLFRSANGRIYWIVDAYTTSSYYPYSEPYSQNAGDTNYIRNSSVFHDVLSFFRSVFGLFGGVAAGGGQRGFRAFNAVVRRRRGGFRRSASGLRAAFIEEIPDRQSADQPDCQRSVQVDRVDKS